QEAEAIATAVAVTPITPEETIRALAWNDPMLELAGATLADLACEFPGVPAGTSKSTTPSSKLRGSVDVFPWTMSTASPTPSKRSTTCKPSAGQMGLSYQGRARNLPAPTPR